MTLTVKIKLLPTPEQENLLRQTMREYIRMANDVLDYAIAIDSLPRMTSRTVHAPLPSALRGQCLRDVRSAWRRFLKAGRFPIFKKPVAVWNNQNYRIEKGYIVLPLWDQKCARYAIRAAIPDEVLQRLRDRKLGTLRITLKNGKLIAQVAYEQEELAPVNSTNEMAVDLGIKCPAVCYTSTGKVKFVGNGRRNRQVRRRHYARRKKLGKQKKLAAIRKSSDKEQRWMRDQDHKISREIVNFAIQNDVAVIKLEQLAGIRRTARKSRKNNRALHSWSFHRLAGFIEYKAALAGIKVEYVDPAYTSQTCPRCGARHKATDRDYTCSCGYRCHRDLVGARNILLAA